MKEGDTDVADLLRGEILLLYGKIEMKWCTSVVLNLIVLKSIKCETGFILLWQAMRLCLMQRRRET